MKTRHIYFAHKEDFPDTVTSIKNFKIFVILHELLINQMTLVMAKKHTRFHFYQGCQHLEYLLMNVQVFHLLGFHHSGGLAGNSGGSSLNLSSSVSLSLLPTTILSSTSPSSFFLSPQLSHL